MNDTGVITIEYVVMKGKTELERLRVQLSGGVVIAATDVAGAGAASGEPCDVTFTLTPALAEAVRGGTLDISVGFMRGEIKMSGDNAALFAALPVLARTNGFSA